MTTISELNSDLKTKGVLSPDKQRPLTAKHLTIGDPDNSMLRSEKGDEQLNVEVIIELEDEQVPET
jgi:hypothetical protein